MQEFVIVGTQADASWFEFPVRYAHEDGSDGVVRVSAANLNFNHFEIGPKEGCGVASLAGDQDGDPGGFGQRQIFRNTTR